MHGPPLSFPAAASALDQPSDLCSVLSVVSPSSPSPSPELESAGERAHHIQQIVVTLPRTVIIVMRYLFAFLNQWVQSHSEATHTDTSVIQWRVRLHFFLSEMIHDDGKSWLAEVIHLSCPFGTYGFDAPFFFVGCPSDNDLIRIYLAWAPAAGLCCPTFSDVRVSFFWFGFKKQKCNLGEKACQMEVLSQRTPCLNWIRTQALS